MVIMDNPQVFCFDPKPLKSKKDLLVRKPISPCCM